MCSRQDKDKGGILIYVKDAYDIQYLLKLWALLCLQQVYKWTGDNMFFIKGDTDSLAFGGGRWGHVTVVSGRGLGIVLKISLLFYIILYEFSGTFELWSQNFIYLFVNTKKYEHAFLFQGKQKYIF